MSDKFDTILIHAGEPPDAQTGAVAPVLYRTKTYAQKFGVTQHYLYSRGANPTREALEKKLGALEEAEYVVTYSSGNAATTAFFMAMNPGDHVLFCQEIYGGTYRLVEEVMSRFGITCDYANFHSKEAIKAAIKPNTKWLFVETPTNPSLHVIDLKLVNEVSKETGIPFVVDGTFAPPCTTKAINYGAKVVIQSLSKYIAGHNDVLAGALITNDKELYEKYYFLFRTCGAILSPDECYRILQGMKTLAMRWETVCTTAYAVADSLERSSKVGRVNYPDLLSHPNHDVAFTQMKTGAGGVVSFELSEKYHTQEKIKQFVDAATSTGVITYAESLASPETILAYPPLMSHRSLPETIRKSLGISDGFFRLSVGFEDAMDIVNALHKALKEI